MLRALVLCKQASVARVYRVQLKGMFETVHSTISPVKAFALLKTAQYQLILVIDEPDDSSMRELIAKVREMQKNALVIISHDRGDETVISKASAAGADGLLEYGADADILRMCIKAAERGMIVIRKEIIDQHLQSYLPTTEVMVKLTQGDIDILRLVSEGLSNADIATRLYYDVNTIKYKLNGLMAHFGARNRAHLAAKAIRMRVI